MLTEIGHPFARGEEVYDVTFENVQAGLRTDYLFRIANQRGGIVLGTGDLSELALGWSTYGVGDQMSHYNVNGGVPKTLIQHLIRWVISSNQFDNEVNEVLALGAGHRDQPGADPDRGGRGDPEQRGQGRAVCAAGLFVVPGAAVRLPAVEGRVPGLACVERSQSAATGPPDYPADKRPAYSLKEIRHWLQVFVQRYYSFSPVQEVGDAERAQGVGRRIAVAARGLAGAVGHVGPRPGWTRSNARSPRTDRRSSALTAPTAADQPRLDTAVIAPREIDGPDSHARSCESLRYNASADR